MVGIKNFKPRLYQETILATTASKNTLVVLPTGMGKCLEYSQPILFSDGPIVPIGQYVEAEIKKGNITYETNNHIVVKPRLKRKLVSLNEKGKLNNANIKCLHKIKTTKKLLKISTESGAKITVTPEHPCLTLNNNLEWKRADRFKLKEFIATPRRLNFKGRKQKIEYISNFQSLPKNKNAYVTLNNKFAKKNNIHSEYKVKDLLNLKLTEIDLRRNIENIFVKGARSVATPMNPIWETSKELYYLVGLVIAEGRVSGGIKFYNNNKVLLNLFKKFSKKVFGIQPNIIKGGLTLKSTSLHYFLRNVFGLEPAQHSRDKKIAAIIMKDTNENIAWFISALYDGEASVRKEGLIEFMTASKELACNLCYLLLRFGIQSRFSEKVAWATNSPVKKKRTYYRIYIGGKKNLKTFRDKIGFKAPEKEKKINNYLDSKKVSNPNLDVIPVSQIIRTARLKLGLSSTKWKDFDLPSIDTYERGERKPSHKILKKMISGLEKQLNRVKGLKKEIEWIRRQIRVLEIPPSEIIKSLERKTSMKLYLERVNINSQLYSKWKIGAKEPKLFQYSPFMQLVKAIPLETQYSNFKLESLLDRIKKFQNKLKLPNYQLRIKHNIFCLPTTRKRLIKYIKTLIKDYHSKIECEKKIVFLKQLLNSDIYWDKIKRIEKVDRKWVYDISLEKDFNFIGGFNGGVIAHNTAISLMLGVQRLKNYPKSKILILAPTKPLVEQHFNTFKKFLDMDESKFAFFTGLIKPEIRAELWKDAQVIFSTPQGLENDIISGRIKLEEVSLLTIDECHRAVKDYSYVFVADQYQKKSKFPRILALTASPGSDLEHIEAVIQNLHIEGIEIRTPEDPDVKPYVQEVDIKYKKVELPKPFLEIKKYLDMALKEKLQKLKNIGILEKKNLDYVNKTDLLKLQATIQGRIAKGERDFTLWQGASVCAEIMKLQHASELLETQGIVALSIYFQKLLEQSRKTKTKAIQNLVQDVNFKTALLKTSNLQDQKIEHPKLIALQKLIEKEIENSDELKAIVFNQYRDNAVDIKEKLNEIKGIRAEIFVGQTKKGGTGYSQKEQKEVLDKFREGIFNILIATSIGEEGLDIPKVDLVIFYEPVGSAIRQIQRRGRTGRLEKGRVIIFMTSNTRDEGSRWAAHHKEKRMYRNLEKLRNDLTLKLNPQPTLHKYIKEDNLKIFADVREKGNGIIKELVNSGVNVVLQRLDCGDYLLSSKVGIEFKTKEDFVNSIIDGRLLSQIKELKRNYEKPLLIIEGTQDIYSVRNVHPNSIRGMLATIVIDYGIPILYTRDSQESASIIKIITKREQTDSQKEFVMHATKPMSQKEQQEYIIASFPGVGPTLSKPLLNKFKTIKKLVNAKEDQLQKIDKIGPEKARKIREILDKEYEP